MQRRSSIRMGTEVISLGPGIISEMFNQRVEEEDFDQCTSINGSAKYLYVRLSLLPFKARAR